MERVALEGHFAEGAAGIMSLVGGVEAPFVLEIVEPGTRFLDRLTIGDLVIRIDHQVTATDGGAEVAGPHDGRGSRRRRHRADGHRRHPGRLRGPDSALAEGDQS